MKKCIVFLLCIIVLPIIASCSKEEKEPDLITGEAKILNETGISFMNASGFEGDQVVFKLRHNGSEKEYGQSLSGYNYTKLQSGAKTIYQMQVYKDGEQVPFNAFTKDIEGNQKEVKSTSVVVIKENQVFEIVLEEEETE